MQFCQHHISFIYNAYTLLDQLANCHSVPLRYLVPLPWYERFNGIPMEIVRLISCKLLSYAMHSPQIMRDLVTSTKMDKFIFISKVRRNDHISTSTLHPLFILIAIIAKVRKSIRARYFFFSFFFFFFNFEISSY